MLSRKLVLLIGLLVFIIINSLNPRVGQFHYRVNNVYPHDPDAFTQGLVFHNGSLIESTGLYGKSSLRKVDLYTGNIIKYVYLPDFFFGEGVTIHNERIIQLTWKSGFAFIYDKDLLVTGNFTLETEGWGLTNDGDNLIVSDGTSILYFLDPYTYVVKRRVFIIDHITPVSNVNELEYVNGLIYANVWNKDLMIIIEPLTGIVKGHVDLSGLRDYVKDIEVDVLNGIAFFEGRFFITGKFWPFLFEIELVN